jgi:hypothetical protein
MDIGLVKEFILWATMRTAASIENKNIYGLLEV